MEKIIKKKKKKRRKWPAGALAGNAALQKVHVSAHCSTQYAACGMNI